jgi:hypothetical protein
MDKNGQKIDKKKDKKWTKNGQKMVNPGLAKVVYKI